MPRLYTVATLADVMDEQSAMTIEKVGILYVEYTLISHDIVGITSLCLALVRLKPLKVPQGGSVRNSLFQPSENVLNTGHNEDPHGQRKHNVRWPYFRKKSRN